MKKLLLGLLLFISAASFGQTPSEISRIIAATVDPSFITGQSAQTAVVNNIIPATAGATGTDVGGYGSALIQIVSTGTGGTFIFEGSNDPSANFQTIPVWNQSIATGTAITAAITATSSQIGYIFPVTFRYVRVRIVTTITGGSIQAISKFSRNAFFPNYVQVAQATAANLNVTPASTPLMTGAIASAAAADATANPTGAGFRMFGHNYNGATWDRPTNNVNTTTGDVGAKTATFNGATQTNFNSRGATITVLCGTVTGTTPTLAAQLQFSPDGGTTWLNMGAASGTVTATGNTITFQVYPTNFSTAGATPGALTTGATQTVQLNAVLPRTWRLAYTITGTTPSFTLTGVYVNYTL